MAMEVLDIRIPAGQGAVAIYRIRHGEGSRCSWLHSVESRQNQCVMPVPRRRWVDEPARAQTIVPSWLSGSRPTQARERLAWDEQERRTAGS